MDSMSAFTCKTLYMMVRNVFWTKGEWAKILLRKYCHFTAGREDKQEGGCATKHALLIAFPPSFSF